MKEFAQLIAGSPDAVLIVSVWLIAVAFLTLGYWQGGDAWEDKFNQGPIRDGSKIGGFTVELIMVSITAALVIFVNQLTPAAPLVASLRTYWPFALGLLILGFLIVLYHSRSEVAEAAKEEEERHKRNMPVRGPAYADDLWRGYLFYNVFSTAIFAFYVVAALAVVGQLLADNAAFQAARAALDESLVVLQTWKFANTPSVIASIEEANSLLWGSIHAITEQINTVMLLFFFVLVINYVVAYTPIRAAYSEAAVWYTHAISGLVLFLVFVTGWYLYYNEYLVLIRGMITKLTSAEVRGKILGGDWEITQRYYELINELRGRQGITGFIVTMSSERGGVLLVLYFLQWFIDRNHPAKRRGAPGEEPGRPPPAPTQASR